MQLQPERPCPAARPHMKEEVQSLTDSAMGSRSAQPDLGRLGLVPQQPQPNHLRDRLSLCNKPPLSEHYCGWRYPGLSPCPLHLRQRDPLHAHLSSLALAVIHNILLQQLRQLGSLTPAVSFHLQARPSIPSRSGTAARTEPILGRPHAQTTERMNGSAVQRSPRKQPCACSVQHAGRGWSSMVPSGLGGYVPPSKCAAPGLLQV